MLTRLGLRLRIFLFFCLLALAGAGLAAGALAFGWSRAEEGPLPVAPFVTAAIVFAFLNTGLVLAVWLLFDENIAKPIDRLSANLRLRAHAGVQSDVATDTARYLGDLAPAAQALAQTLNASISGAAGEIVRETEALTAEREQFTSLLTEIPIATILLNPAQEIVLYDGQAAAVLSAVAPPRLRAPLADYFDLSALAQAVERAPAKGVYTAFTLSNPARDIAFNARFKALEAGGFMIFVDVETQDLALSDPRPLVFDFDLINPTDITDMAKTPLRELCFVPFDTETTGLSVQKDEIVQLGAVRVLNGRIVEGEVMDVYVNPGRPIPPSSTKIHHITDADVARADGIGTVARAFHHFARDAVLVAHNAPFDIGLLRKSQAIAGVEWTHPVLDTVLLSAVVFGTTEDHSLDALCDRLSITIPASERHTALGDAKATAEVLVRLLPLLEKKGVSTFDELITQTRRHSRLLEDLNG